MVVGLAAPPLAGVHGRALYAATRHRRRLDVHAPASVSYLRKCFEQRLASRKSAHV